MDVLGIDIGGTALKAGLVSEQGILRKKWTIPVSDLRQGDFITGFLNWLSKLLTDNGLASVGIGIPGLVTPNGSFIHCVSNLHEIEGEQWINALRSAYPGLNLYLANDANAAAYGAYRFCNEIRTDTFGYITLGTGLGSALILDGKIYAGSNGNGPELGMIPLFDGRTVEEMTGKDAILNLAVDWFGRETLYALSGGNDFDTSILLGLAMEGHPTARRVFQQTGSYLGRAVCVFMQMFDVSAIYIGGGISPCIPYMDDAVREEVMKNLSPYYHRNFVFQSASLGNDAGILGAAALCF
jgi:glucokinase